MTASLVPGVRVLAQESSPRRLPLSEFAKDAKLVEALRRGIQVMRERKGSDPRSWFFQCAIHAYSDEIYAQALALDPAVKKVEARKYWKQCPHFGQSSANFLIWHRAYLYHFERILRDASGEPELAVPYWNYDEVGQRGFPELFAPQFLDREKTLANPLHHANRELAFVRGLFTLSEPVGAATHAREAAQFFSEPGVTGFGGDVLADGSKPGAVEQRPHNDLHVAVGGVVGSGKGAMAEITTAAFDPVFWVHHANIDRLWRQWAASPGKSWGPLPPDEWFDEAPWVFVDVDGSEVRKPRLYYLEAENLPVAYADSTTLGGLALPARGGTAL
ncbi:MAG TPA: tyrosinase family protein, partial [Allosphingosinicella sp.]|nr:tyrosinase family protein [Allosphingosinicella sp.]